MTDDVPPNLDSPPLSPGPPAPPPPQTAAPAPTPVTRRLKPRPATLARIQPVTPPPSNEPPQERRDFFSEAMREMLNPFAGIIERKLHPLLAAIEAIPDQAEKFTKTNMKDVGAVALDQLHTRINNLLPGGPLPKRMPATFPPPPPKSDRYLRPPGAMQPGEFESVCSRCGKCVEACPAEAIKLDTNGLLADGFPYILAEEQPCVVSEDLACMKSCPTGALQLIDRLAIDMGTAKVDHTLCLRDHGENCTLCLDVCPVIDTLNPANSALVISPATGKVLVHKNICIGCGLCESRCPTEPRAIIVIPHAPPTDPMIA